MKNHEIEYNSETQSWMQIGVFAGILACIVYPIMILVPLPHLLQLILGASFGPLLAMASIALMHVLQVYHRKPSIQLAAVFNSLAGALVTAMIIIQLAINYSSAPATDEQLVSTIRRHLWDVDLGLDVSFDIFVGLGTLFFSINMINDPRFGKVIGWFGIFTSIVVVLGANLYYFPDPPYTQGFPHVGIFTGLWYLGVVIMIIRSMPLSFFIPFIQKKREYPI